MKTLNTQFLISTYLAKNITLACYVGLCLEMWAVFWRSYLPQVK